MRIGIDARSITGKTCGVSRVVLRMLEALSRMGLSDQFIVYTDQIDDLELGNGFLVRRTGLSRMNVLNDLRFSRMLYADGVDIFLSGHSWLPLFLRGRMLKTVMIYDIFSVTDSDFFRKRGLLGPLYRFYFFLITMHTVRRADCVFTISEYCKREIQRVYPFAKRIEVVYLSPGIAYDHRLPEPLRSVNAGYILYVGNFRSYKNIDVLLRGYALYAEAAGALRLVLAGNDDPATLRQLITELGIGDRIDFFTRPVDAALYGLYRHAAMLVQPSKYEGFGIPPIEAMSFDVPVIVSDAEALIEVTAGSAIVFRKDDPADLCHAIQRIESDATLRANFVSKGKKNIKRFSWDASARKLMEILRCDAPKTQWSDR